MRHPRLIAFLIVLLLLFGTLTGLGYFYTRADQARLPLAAVTGPRPQITPPRVQTIPGIAVAKAVGWKDGEAPSPAAGLRVSSFATGLIHPRWLYRLPNGDILVAETGAPTVREEGNAILNWVTGWLKDRAGAGVGSANRITLLRDTNGDGIAETRSTLISQGLDSPMGMALIGNRLYVANHNAVVVYPYTPGQTRITQTPVRLASLPPGAGHWTRTLVASADGQYLYVGVGSTSNIAENGLANETNRAAILQITIANGAIRPYANGLRNPVGLAWEPLKNTLWTVVNERDMLGSDVPPDYLTEVEFGDFFGWPYTYWGGYEDPRVKPARPDLLQYTRRPDYALGAHTASLGLAFGKLGNFPYGAFISQHGSWNREPLAGFQVVFVAFNAAGFPSGPMHTVLGNFLDGDDNARGRPVGLAFDNGGGLLVADDVGNRIWRISAQ